MRNQIKFCKILAVSFGDNFLNFINNAIIRHCRTTIFCPLLFAFAASILSSCSHYYYVQGVHNVPLFKEKNEFRVSGYYGEGDESQSIEIQSAYSVTDKIGIMANFMSAHGGNVSSQNYGNGKYFDGAIGYYKPVGRFGVAEIYGGIGRGKQHHEYSSFFNNQSFGATDIAFTKLYIQPSFGFTFNYFDIALSSRISRLSFNVIGNSIWGNPELNDRINNLTAKNHLFFEPGITLRGGFKSVKLQIQAAYSAYLNNPKIYIGEEYHLSIGIYCALGKRFR